MARAFVFPDPNDRSANSPKVIVDAPKVLGLYNQEHKGEKGFVKKQIVTGDIRDWFQQKAEDLGWDDSEFVGNQCTLSADIPFKGKKIQ